MKQRIAAMALLVMISPAWAARPNVLLIISDDLRTELGCYGVKGIQSPNLDRLAARGRRFEYAYCQYPVCNPSRTSFLTGLRPDQTGILENNTPFRKKLPDVVTLPQHFRANGYFTAGLGKVFHRGLSLQDVRREMDDDKGFDELTYFNPTAIGEKGEGRNITGGKLPWCRWLAAEGDDEDQPDGQIAARAIKLMEEQRDKPFFIAAGFHKPHDPFVAPKKYFDMYPLESLALAKDPPDATGLTKHAAGGYKEFAKFSDQDQREYKRAYYAGASFMDAQVGKLLDALDRLKLSDKTIIVFLGDHGYHLGERGWWSKNTLFEFSARVPLIVMTPGMRSPGEASRQIAEFVDVYPTLLDYCDLKPPHDLAGKTLRPLIEDPAATWDKPAFTQVQRGKIAGRSVRSGKWRYIEWADGAEGVELYDVENDPGNYHNLADVAEHKDTITQLKPLLKR